MRRLKTNAWRPPPVSQVFSPRWLLLKENEIFPICWDGPLSLCMRRPYFCQRPLGVSTYFNDYFNSIKIFYLFIHSLQNHAITSLNAQMKAVPDF